MFAESILMGDMSSAILLLSMLIHIELIPSRKLIIREQKKQASKRLTFYFFKAPVVQLKAEALLVTFSKIRNGLVVATFVVTKWSVAQ